MYKNITEFDIFGNGSQNTLGNGLTENTAYSNKSGQMLLKTIAKNNSNIMNIDYSVYDGFGNLKAVDITTGNIGNQHSFSETYDYDALHRLESNAVNGISTINYSYDAVGNLLSKSDYATQYDYENGATGGPNAVKRVYRGGWKSFGYDTRGNMTSGDGLTSATYNAMDKPTQIVKDGKTLNFTYGPQHMRFKQVNGSVTTFYSGKLYEEEVTDTKTTWRAYIDDIAVISQTTNEGATIRYTHRDRLGSARVFTDHNGQVEAERNYDPFGKPRLASGGLKSFGASKLGDLADAKTNRGFTDHEHLDSVELIHMNGRVYDYNLGRFLSVDPFIQAPGNSQSINPYSYGMNNPLAGTDPTGYLFFLIPAIVEIGGGALALYGAWEGGQTIGNAINDISSGTQSTSDVLVSAGKSLAVDAAMSATGAKLAKLAPKSLTDKVDNLVNGKSNGAENSQSASSNKPESTTEIGANSNTETVYHGTDSDSANSITNEGLSVSRNQNADHLADESGFSVTSDKQEAMDMAEGKTAMRNADQNRTDLKPAVVSANKSDLPNMKTSANAKAGETYDNANESKISRDDFDKVGPDVFKKEDL